VHFVFKYLRLKSQPDKVATYPGNLGIDWLSRDSQLPITLRHINALPEKIKRRIYRNLLPPDILSRFGVHPITWNGSDGEARVRLLAEEGEGVVHLSAWASNDPNEEFFRLEIADNAYDGIDIHLLLLNDPNSPRFQTDYDESGNSTLFGTARRNLAEEERAMQAGLAPAQIRSSLGGSRSVFKQIDAFLATLGHQAYFLEPLTYASAWVFERRGFAYVRGHKLMDDIHRGFQPGGRLEQAMDGSTPFRQPGQEGSVRGRAWAIQDGILEAIGVRWDNLRMIKQVGRDAGVETFPGAVY
jgi:hypothetical protein